MFQECFCSVEKHKFSRRNSFTTVAKLQIQSNYNQILCCFPPGLRHSCLLEFQESTGEKSLALAERKVNTAVSCSSNESYFYLKSPSSPKHCLGNWKHKKKSTKKNKKESQNGCGKLLPNTSFSNKPRLGRPGTSLIPTTGLTQVHCPPPAESNTCLAKA